MLKTNNFHFRKLLKNLGAFFIKRKIDKENGKKDVLYRAVLKAYMENILTSGNYMEIFLEGRRSRNGKCGIPKGESST